MLFWLFAAIVCINTASLPATPSPQACTNQGLKTPLTPSGYSLPLTSYDINQTCTYFFTVPKGYFAYVDLKAIELQWKEFALIMDSTGVYDQNDLNDYSNQNFSSVQSWPTDFYVMIQTIKEGKSIVQMSLDIQVLPETPNANIVKSYVTFPGSSAVFLYSNTWNDGESYKFRSKSGKVYVLGATDPNLSITMDDNWNNVFVYEGSVFKGTLATVVQALWHQKPYISTSNEVTLYCTKKVNVTGAVMVTDYSNVQGLTYSLEYVPQGISSLYKIELDCSKAPEAAYTVVSDRTNPRNLTVAAINEYGRDGVLSYIAGGPIQNHSNSIRFNVTEPPTVIRGYANTFYLNNGTDAVWFTL